MLDQNGVWSQQKQKMCVKERTKSICIQVTYNSTDSGGQIWIHNEGFL